MQKIDGNMLDTYGMVVAAFLVQDKASWVRFFEKTFRIANVSPEIVFGVPFLTLNSANIDFLEYKLWWKTYTTKKALPTTRHIELVGRKEFAAVAFNLEYEIYVVYVESVSSNASPGSSLLNVYPLWRPQISGFITEKASKKISAEYLDFADIFFPDLAFKLPKHIGINDHAIKLVNRYQQSPYRLIYSQRPIELETLKAYIETNLANRFIRLSNSPAGAFILFDRKSESLFQLCVDYQDLNNLLVKNRYPLPLIDELLDRLGRARRFIQLDHTSAYHQMRICKEDK